MAETSIKYMSDFRVFELLGSYPRKPVRRGDRRDMIKNVKIKIKPQTNKKKITKYTNKSR